MYQFAKLVAFRRAVAEIAASTKLPPGDLPSPGFALQWASLYSLVRTPNLSSGFLIASPFVIVGHADRREPTSASDPRFRPLPFPPEEHAFSVL